MDEDGELELWASLSSVNLDISADIDDISGNDEDLMRLLVVSWSVSVDSTDRLRLGSEVRVDFSDIDIEI